MTTNEQRSPSFIIGCRHGGRSFLTAIKGYSSILQNEIVGEVSGIHRKALQVIFDCCDTPTESWHILTELIEQNEGEKVMEILSQADETGQSYLEQKFISKSLAAMEIARNESSTILLQSEQLTDEQRHYVEIIHNNCQREIEVWKEIAEYFS
jgi:hypothetical protein